MIHSIQRYLTRLGYRFRYYRRKLANALGLCATCGTQLNHTSRGRGICPRCGK